jgi:hypothetical protein
MMVPDKNLFIILVLSAIIVLSIINLKQLRKQESRGVEKGGLKDDGDGGDGGDDGDGGDGGDGGDEDVKVLEDHGNENTKALEYDDDGKTNSDEGNEDNEGKTGNKEVVIDDESRNVGCNITDITDGQEIYNHVKDMKIRDAINYLVEKYNKIHRIDCFLPPFPDLYVNPPINRGSYSSKGERHCVEFLNSLFAGYTFKKTRPSWLKNPKTGYSLELDAYCPELSLALEYNGYQHFVYPNIYNGSLDSFLEQRKRDEIKENILKEKGIYLIKISYLIPLDKIPLAIYSCLLSLAYKIYKVNES